MTNDPTSAAYEDLEKKIYDKFYYGCSMADAEAYTRETMQLFKQAIAEAETRGRLKEQEKFQEWLHDPNVGVSTIDDWSNERIATIQANADGANGRDGENSDDTIS